MNLASLWRKLLDLVRSKRRELALVREPSDRARAWVHAYAAGGAAYAFVPIPIPGSTTAGLVALEATMVHALARIYGVEIHAKDAAAIAAGLEVAGGALKTIARGATSYVPGIGWLIRGAIAAITIESIGRSMIAVFERRQPQLRLDFK